jgi:release factor glutamine methyltransferase
MPDDYLPMMSEERARRLREWHDSAHEDLRASVPVHMSFMGLDLYVSEDVLPPGGPGEGDLFHKAVFAEVKPSDRVLDMGTGSGVSAILAAKVSSDVIAVDINPKAIDCAIGNAERNGVRDRITFLHGDVFDQVEGDFDLIVFDPPFRWFAPRDLLEMSHADEGYRTLRKFMAEAGEFLRPDGRILLNFGTSGDIDYLYSLIDRTDFDKEVVPYGEATRVGLIAHYYTIKLTIHSPSG